MRLAENAVARALQIIAKTLGEPGQAVNTRDRRGTAPMAAVELWLVRDRRVGPVKD